MALERRNALAAQLLGVVKKDVETRYAIGMSLHAMDFDDMGRTRRGSGIESGMGESLLGALSNKAVLIPFLTILGVGLTGLVTNHILGKLDEDPTDPDKKQRSIGERARDFLGPKAEEEGGAQVTPVALSHDVSPLLPKGTEIEGVKTAKSTAAQRDAIAKGAADGGVDYSLMYAVAGAESSFRDSAAADSSTAVGILQFTAPTWNYLIKLFKLDYTLKDRADPQKSAQVAGLYLNRITKTLTRVLGRKPSYGETYLGYFLGPTGGGNFLTALIKNPNAIGAELFPSAAASNKNVFYNKGEPMTLGQILAKLEGKIGSYAADSGTTPKSSVASGDQAPTPPAVQKTATATPIDPQVTSSVTAPPAKSADAPSIPTNQIANVKLASRTAEADASPAPKQTIVQAPAQSSPSKSKTNKDADAGLPFRGRDGRLYKG